MRPLAFALFFREAASRTELRIRPGRMALDAGGQPFLAALLQRLSENAIDPVGAVAVALAGGGANPPQVEVEPNGDLNFRIPDAMVRTPWLLACLLHLLDLSCVFDADEEPEARSVAGIGLRGPGLGDYSQQKVVEMLRQDMRTAASRMDERVKQYHATQDGVAPAWPSSPENILFDVTLGFPGPLDKPAQERLRSLAETLDSLLAWSGLEPQMSAEDWFGDAIPYAVDIATGPGHLRIRMEDPPSDPALLFDALATLVRSRFGQVGTSWAFRFWEV